MDGKATTEREKKYTADRMVARPASGASGLTADDTSSGRIGHVNFGPHVPSVLTIHLIGGDTTKGGKKIGMVKVSEPFVRSQHIITGDAMKTFNRCD